MGKLLGTAKPSQLSLRVQALAISVVLALGLQACELRPTPRSATSGSSASSSSASATSTTDYCTLFSNNSYDYQICKGCITSTGSTNITTLAQCVHANAGSTGGATCVGLSCGPGQVADFASCSCKDGTISSTFGSQPGQEDTLTPYLTAGMFIGNRYCPSNPIGCFWRWSSGMTADGMLPPQNVLTDVGYTRWDLGLDASQFPTYTSTSSSDDYANIPFMYSSSTMVGNYSLNVQLKPNTVISSTMSSAVNFCDCVENFSGTSALSSVGSSCLDTSFNCDMAASSLSLSVSGASAFAQKTKISLNGPAANSQLTQTLTNTQPITLGFGLGKLDANSAAAGSGLIANLGYYKFTFGPVDIARPTASGTVINRSTISQTTAFNTNLGYKPVDAIESPAFAPETITNGTVSSQSCSDASDPCVITTLYRAPGGSITFQNFSPKYPNHASAMGSLPSGVIAVGTPRVVEDRSGLNGSTTAPYKLRAFVRAADGNMYMSKGDKGTWSNWVNLGRPWFGPDNLVAAAPASGSYVTAGIAKVYWPFTDAHRLANGWPAIATGRNDGLHLVGEPSVVSFFDGTDYYIVIASRVSNLTRATGAPGNYHNAIFYTVGKANVSGTSTFDTVTNWTRWEPVVNGANTVVKIQGNPLLSFGGATTTTDNLYIFGTQIAGTTMAGLAQNYHPPLAQHNSPGNMTGPFNGIECSTFDNATCTYLNGTRNWYSYGHTLQVAYLTDLSTRWSVPCSSDTACTPTDFTFYQFNAANNAGVFISDFTGMKYNTAVTGGNPIIRLFVNALTGFDTTAANCPRGLEWTVPISEAVSGTQCGFLRGRTHVRWMEFDFTTNTVTSDGGATMRYPGANFVGTPYPIDINNTDVGAGAIARFATVADPEATDGAIILADNTKKRLALFGRYTGAGTRTNPPTAQYLVSHYPVIAMDMDAEYYSYYWPGGSNSENLSTGGIDDGGSKFYTMPIFYPTSDIVPVVSQGLVKQVNDVPAYLFTRDSSGRIAVGIWGSSNTGTSGAKMFQWRSVGGLTN